MSNDQKFADLKQRSDVAQIFLVFMATVGDTEKTALALELDPAFVQWLAIQEGWLEKVRRVSVMSKSGKPGDFERAQNRCLNFIQAHRVRMLLDRVLGELGKVTPEELCEKLQTYTKSGQPVISARFFSDLTAALAKTHELSYHALGDSIGERMERAKDGHEHSANDIHAALIAALNNPALSQVSTQDIVLEASEAAVAQLSERKSTGEERQDVTVEKPVDS